MGQDYRLRWSDFWIDELDLGFAQCGGGDPLDPLDALVVSRSSFILGCVVRARPIAVLMKAIEDGKAKRG